MADDIPEGKPAVIPGTEPAGLAGELRTPKSGAIAGILFALTLGTVIVTMSSAIPRDPVHAGTCITSASNRSSVTFAINVIPLTQLVFPIWVLILSLHILVVSMRPPATWGRRRPVRKA